jgi:hypothetical protein
MGPAAYALSASHAEVSSGPLLDRVGDRRRRADRVTSLGRDGHVDCYVPVLRSSAPSGWGMNPGTPVSTTLLKRTFVAMLSRTSRIASSGSWELLDFCRHHGIVLLAFAALGHGFEPKITDDPVITASSACPKDSCASCARIGCTARHRFPDNLDLTSSYPIKL